MPHTATSLGSKVVRVLKAAAIIVAALLLLYSFAFAVVGTVVVVRVARVVLGPVKAVRALQTSNPLTAGLMQECADSGGSADAVPWPHRFVPLDSISPHLVRAVVAAEDDAFYTHPGFDVTAILAAAEINRARNRISHGGSTITQQVAKNLFLTGRREYQRKYMELLYAVLLETYLSKDRILELYLNYAQWGPCLFGAEAAAQAYFGKPAAKLSLFESARMAATLAMPAKLNPRTSHTAFMGKRLYTIAFNLYYRHLIDDTTFTALCGAEPPRLGQDSSMANGSAPAAAEGAFDSTDDRSERRNSHRAERGDRGE